MGWRDLITEEDLAIVAPWMGGRSLHSCGRTRTITGPVPEEHGWYRFSAKPRLAEVMEPAQPAIETLRWLQTGFLVGNRFVPDHAQPGQLERCLAGRFAQVHLLESGLERFSRVEVGATRQHGRLVFRGLAFPLGPEEEVLAAFLDKNYSIIKVRGVIPSLQAAFDLECYQRNRAQERREALERLQRTEATRLVREARQQQCIESLGTGSGRRDMAAIDFHSAAAAALTIGGAELLDARVGQPGEYLVRYRLDGRRYECVCDVKMRIIDAGVCLTDDATGEKGDTFFTLESLPAVIRQADREGVLVVYRHV